MYRSIPGLLAQGKNKHEIAEMFGCKVGTLIVQCSQRQITLRSLKSANQLREAKRREVINLAADTLEQNPIVAEAAQLVALRLEAKARGTTEIGLVARLLEMIVKDRLYNAVLGRIDEKMEGHV